MDRICEQTDRIFEEEDLDCAGREPGMRVYLCLLYTSTVTVHGKGTYVTAANMELLLEEQKKELEAELEQAVQKGRSCGISDEEIRSLLELILEG